MASVTSIVNGVEVHVGAAVNLETPALPAVNECIALERMRMGLVMAVIFAHQIPVVMATLIPPYFCCSS